MEQSNLYKQAVYAYYPSAELVHPLPVKKPSLMYTNRPEQIDQMVEQELQLLKTYYANEEQRYVDQMLLENPITVERRPPPMRPDDTTSATPTSTANANPANSRDVQRQRAESCRKSRYNNKIKKAKLRFRHKYACNKLSESSNVLSCMRDVIAQAESQLLARGFNRAALERMRQTFGVDRCVDVDADIAMIGMTH